jgi:glycerol dehydrogenase
MIKKLRNPANYIQGPGVLSELGSYIGEEERAFVIISASGKERFGSLLDAVHTEIFRGECTRAEIARIRDAAERYGADTIVGIGGGKIIDTAKAVSHHSGLPLIIVPTVASTDAPCSSVCVLYKEDGEFDSYLFLNKSPDTVIVDSEIIVNAPIRLLVAGMGDALSTFFEARACHRSGSKNQIGALPTEAAYAIAELCYKLLLRDGQSAKIAASQHEVTPQVESIIEVNTYLSSVGFESGGLAAAHAIQKGFTHIPALHDVYHGEKVAFCTIAQLIMENAPEQEVRDVAAFCTSVGLPVTFAQMGLTLIDDAQLRKASEVACVAGATIHNMPFEVRPELVYDALLATDALGKTLL